MYNATAVNWNPTRIFLFSSPWKFTFYKWNARTTLRNAFHNFLKFIWGNTSTAALKKSVEVNFQSKLQTMSGISTTNQFQCYKVFIRSFPYYFIKYLQISRIEVDFLFFVYFVDYLEVSQSKHYPDEFLSSFVTHAWHRFHFLTIYKWHTECLFL